MELQALPSRIGQVRRIVSAQLRYWHLDPLIDRAALGVTELLTNVHRHAQPDKTCVVEIELLLDQLMVSVRDWPRSRGRGRYPSFCIALRTRSAVAGTTVGLLLITIETVDFETPARAATLVIDIFLSL